MCAHRPRMREKTSCEAGTFGMVSVTYTHQAPGWSSQAVFSQKTSQTPPNLDLTSVLVCPPIFTQCFVMID